MSVQGRSSARRVAPPLIVASLATAAAATVRAQRRHLRAIAADPEFRALSQPLGGVALPAIVSRDGTELYAESFGGGPAPAATLVLAHGWTEALGWWGPVIRRRAALAPELRIVAYDLRGHGRSRPAADGDYGLERFGEDVEAVLAAVAQPGATAERTAIAGHSLGAMSIAAWAARHDVAARVAATALVNTGLSDLIGGALIFGELGARLAPSWLGRGVLGSGRTLLPVSTPLSLAAVRHVAFGPDAGDGAVAFYERMLTATEPSARAAVGIALSSMDLSAAVARITVPTLVIAGDRDRLTPPEHARRIHAALPRPVGLQTLERTGHMSALERPAELTAALARLLSDTGVAEADGPRPADRRGTTTSPAGEALPR